MNDASDDELRGGLDVDTMHGNDGDDGCTARTAAT